MTLEELKRAALEKQAKREKQVPHGARLFALRPQGVSLAAVATAARVTAATLWQMEHGTIPTVRTAIRIARFYGVTVEEIWGSLADTPEEEGS